MAKKGKAMGGKKGKKGNGKRMAEKEFADVDSTFETDGADEQTRQSMKVAAGKTLSVDLPRSRSTDGERAQAGALAGAGDTLVALMDQAVRKAPVKSAAQSHFGVKTGATVVVEQTDTDDAGAHRMQVTTTDKKGHTHTGWVRQNDRAHRYFRLVEEFPGIVDPGPGVFAGHGNRQCWDGAVVTARKDIVTRKAAGAKAHHSFKLKAGEQGVCNATAVAGGVEYARIVGPTGARRQHTGWIEMKPGLTEVEGGSHGMGDIDAGFRAAAAAAPAAGAVAMAEGVPPVGKRKPKKNMSRKEKKAWEKSEEERKEKLKKDRVAKQKQDDEAVEAERTRVEAELDAALRAEKDGRCNQLIAFGKGQMAQEQYAEAQGTFQKAVALQDADGVTAELESLFSAAKTCRVASELAVEADLFMEMDRPKLAVLKLEEAVGLDWVQSTPALKKRYSAALNAAQQAVSAMEERERAEEEEQERLFQEEMERREEEAMFQRMEKVRIDAKQGLENAHNRRECRDVASLCQKTLALDPDEKFRKRGEIQTIGQRAIKKARAYKAADAAASLLDDGFLEDAVEMYMEALALDPVNSIIQDANDLAVQKLVCWSPSVPCKATIAPQRPH